MRITTDPYETHRKTLKALEQINARMDRPGWNWAPNTGASLCEMILAETTPGTETFKRVTRALLLAAGIADHEEMRTLMRWENETWRTRSAIVLTAEVALSLVTILPLDHAFWCSQAKDGDAR